MPAPKEVAGVLRFCGLAQYLARFLPNLAEVASPLRALTFKEDQWNERQPTKIPSKLSRKWLVKLNHYNPAMDLVLQTDASSHGLGAAQLQDGNPIAYASQALTRTKQN